MTETNELTFSRYFVYDAASNLKQRTDRNGLVQEFDYDHLNRNVQELWKDGVTVVNTIDYVYDAASRLETASDDFSSFAYLYDFIGRNTQVIADNGGPIVKLDFQYDEASNRTALLSSIDFGGGFVDDLTNEYVFDGLNRVTRIDQTSQAYGSTVADKRADFTYRANGQFDTITRYNDLAGGGTNEVATSVYGYDLMSRITSLTHTHDVTEIAAYAWTWDIASRIDTQSFTSSTGDYGDTGYGYDDFNQLTTADHDGYIPDEAYAFDANGNRTGGGYDTDPNNRLFSDGIWNYEYDDEGNRLWQERISSASVDDKRIEYGWDHRNRLTSITYKNNGGTVTKQINYSYDLFDRRIAKLIDPDGAGIADAVLTEFGYDGIHELFEFTEGDLTRRNFYGLVVDQILASEEVTSLGSAGDVLWAAADHLGSVRDLVDNAGNVANHVVFDSFGNVISETEPLVVFPFGYTARDIDEESLLQWNRARYYDPTVGRWVSEDPIGFAAGDANMSRYVRNSPLSFTDPTGMDQFGYGNPSPGPRPAPNRRALLPNWNQGAGQLHYTKFQLIIDIQLGCDGKTADQIVSAILGELASFSHFNDGANKSATVNVDTKTMIAYFDLLGFFNGHGSDAINDDTAAVRLTTSQRRREITGQTLDDHQLVGVRKWRIAKAVKVDNCLRLIIETESYERTRTGLNAFGLWFNGEDEQKRIWIAYLTNLSKYIQATYYGTQVGDISSIVKSLGFVPNPWGPDSQFVPPPPTEWEHGFPMY